MHEGYFDFSSREKPLKLCTWGQHIYHKGVRRKRHVISSGQ
jgi:hypothetical protein